MTFRVVAIAVRGASRHVLATALLVAAGCGNGTIEPPPPDPVATTVSMSASALSFAALGETGTVSATVLDQFGNAMTGATVSWSSVETDVATVSPAGEVTAVGNGVTTVRATSGSAAGSVTVTVEQRPASVSTSEARLAFVSFTDTVTLSATAEDAGGSPVDMTALEWTSDDEDVVTVDSVGLVTAIGNGATVITATLAPATATVDVTVEQRVASLELVRQPWLAESGSTLSESEVHLLDARGSLATNASLEVTASLASNVCSATLSGVRTVAATAGVARFSELALDVAGWGRVLEFEADGASGAESHPFGIWTDGLWTEGSWHATGALPFPARDLQLTTLRDGRVLVGAGPHLYDPVTGMFVAGAQASGNRPDGFTVSELADGRWLFIGGYLDWSTSEVFDPEQDTFSPHGGTNAHRVYHAATTMADGRILVTGGMVDGDSTHSEAEIYDPASQSFAPTGPLLDRRHRHASALLPDGRVLVFGGSHTTGPGVGQALATSEYFDPATGDFTEGPMFDGSPSRSAPYESGLLMLDHWFQSWRDRTAFYDPGSGMVSEGPAMSQPHLAGQVTALPDGSILVTGGSVGTGPVVTDGVELLDPRAGAFVPVDPMLAARQQHGAALLEDGRVLVVGGYGGTSNLATAELLRPPECFVP